MPRSHVARNSSAIDLDWTFEMTVNGSQQRFQHTDYFTCNPSITQPIFNRFQTVPTVTLRMS